MTIQTINPATGKLIKNYPAMDLAKIQQIIDQSYQAFLVWRETTFPERANKLNKLAEILLELKNQAADLITEEMGKPTKLARAEIEKCAWLCQEVANHGEEYLKPQIVKTEMQKSYVAYQPLGPVFAIMPWNFPFWQVFRFGGPAIMAGNSCLLKPAPITTGCGLLIEKIFKIAGFPENLFQVLIIETNLASEVINHPKISGVTLTGSVKAGSIVGAQAAKAIKKTVLELGGSDPYIILEDADLDLAVEQCVLSRLNNCGQSCIAAKRIIVLEKVQKLFEEKLLAKIKAYQTETPLGPLARADLRETVDQQVQKSIKLGAELIIGGQIPQGDGFFYPATVLKKVKPGMPAYDEEIFGPVISIITATSAAQAIKIANDSVYGLGAAVFTKDINKGEKIALQLEAGFCGVNTLVASDPRLPFGGIKSSGFGRELSAAGIREFTNIKTINIK